MASIRSVSIFPPQPFRNSVSSGEFHSNNAPLILATDGSDLRLRQAQAEEIRFFSTNATSSQRKAAPAPLDLTARGAAPVGMINDSTHYVSAPMSGSDVDVAALQTQLEEMALKAGEEPIKLSKYPIKNLSDHDLVGMKEPFEIIPVPQTGNFEKFSLKTPLTTGHEVASKLKHMVAAHEADMQAAEERLAKPVQKKYIPTRSDILLNCSLNGQPDLWRLEQSTMGIRGRIARAAAPQSTLIGHRKQPFDIITAVFQVPELAKRVIEYLPGEDITNLYCTSLQAHVQINTHMESSFSAWIRKWAPDARHVFDWRTSDKKNMAIPDPAGGILPSLLPRTHPAVLVVAQPTRGVPSLKYFCMIARRDETVADILAHLARQGHRCPAGTKTSVLKMWSLMDKPTNAERTDFMGNKEFITDQDLVNMMIFHCKLNLRLNDPIYGPGTIDLTELFMGQKSLICLWEMLFGHNYRDTVSMLKLCIRYNSNKDWRLGQDDTGTQGLRDFMQPTGSGLMGIHPSEIGRTSLEHWGAKGAMYPRLQRPSECILRESIRRGLSFDKHMLPFFQWGTIDVASGRNLCPTEAEIYMDDADFKNRRIDTHLEITPLHIKRSRWDELTHDERRAVLLAQSMRQEQVNQWDMHMHDTEDATEEENAQNNEVLHQMAREDYGVDLEDPTFRVDENANILPRSIVRPALIAGPHSAPLERGHVDAILEERDVELTDPRDDRITSLLEVARRRAMNGGNLPSEWAPSPEDHEFHVPYSAPANFAGGSANHGLTEQEVMDRQIQEQTAEEERILQEVAKREKTIFSMFRPSSD